MGPLPFDQVRSSVIRQLSAPFFWFASHNGDFRLASSAGVCYVCIRTTCLGERAMPRKLTITLEEAVYEGLYRTVGRRRISQFIEDVVRPACGRYHARCRLSGHGFRHGAGSRGPGVVQRPGRRRGRCNAVRGGGWRSIRPSAVRSARRAPR